MIETWMLMAMPETGLSLAEVAAVAQRLRLLMKRTCFGMLVEGDRDVVREALKELRDQYPGRIIAKRRGFTHRGYEDLRQHLCKCRGRRPSLALQVRVPA